MKVGCLVLLLGEMNKEHILQLSVKQTIRHFYDCNVKPYVIYVCRTNPPALLNRVVQRTVPSSVYCIEHIQARQVQVNQRLNARIDRYYTRALDCITSYQARFAAVSRILSHYQDIVLEGRVRDRIAVIKKQVEVHRHDLHQLGRGRSSATTEILDDILYLLESVSKRSQNRSSVVLERLLRILGSDQTNRHWGTVLEQCQQANVCLATRPTESRSFEPVQNKEAWLSEIYSATVTDCLSLPGSYETVWPRLERAHQMLESMQTQLDTGLMPEGQIGSLRTFDALVQKCQSLKAMCCTTVTFSEG